MAYHNTEHDQDALLSGSKIDPLKSPVKWHMRHDEGDHGVIGEDLDLAKSHEAPLNSNMKHHHMTMPHANSQGVVGYEDIIQSCKIAPMEPEDGMMKRADKHTHGLDDETVDASRILPLGEVREE